MSNRKVGTDFSEISSGDLNTLSLPSLEIQNFRCFEHLVIEKLGRVNLIVGKNGVGKTSLLEGLWLLASGASWPVIQSILYGRNELVRYNLPANSAMYEQIEAIQSFFTHPSTKSASAFFRIGGKDAGVLEPCFLEEYYEPYDESYITDVPRDKATHAVQPVIEFKLRNDWTIGIKGYPNPGHIMEPEWPDLPITQGELLRVVIKKSQEDNVVFIPVKGLPWQATARYWDNIALTSKEDTILAFLRTFDPGISRFTFKGDNTQDTVRFSCVRTDCFDSVVPMAKLGEGTQRVFALAMAMSASSDGYLLIDEFETGLHHTIQADVWRDVFKLAHEWNVQVFATTHSWDCVEAFQEAATENEDEGARLIRLQRERHGTAIEAESYNTSAMEAAVNQGSEVR